jgi:hypothetical protein
MVWHVPACTSQVVPPPAGTRWPNNLKQSRRSKPKPWFLLTASRGRTRGLLHVFKCGLFCVHIGVGASRGRHPCYLSTWPLTGEVGQPHLPERTQAGCPPALAWASSLRPPEVGHKPWRLGTPSGYLLTYWLAKSIWVNPEWRDKPIWL